MMTHLSSHSRASNIYPSKEIDLSEETRLAQLQRIEELQSRIGELSPWFGNQSLPGGQSLDIWSSLDYTPSQSGHPVMSDRGMPTIDEFNQLSMTGIQPLDLLEEFNVITANPAAWDFYTEQHGDEAEAGTANRDLRFDPISVSGPCEASLTTSEESMQQTLQSNSPSKTPTSSSFPSTNMIDVKLEPPESATILDLDQSGRGTPLYGATTFATPSPSFGKTRQPNSDGRSPKRRRMANKTKLKVSEFRPRSALPNDMTLEDLAQQSIEAALASRLTPFALHPDEEVMLRKHICQLHVTAYLNIRNRILRLWVRSPLVSVTPEEAAGCATGSRWLGLAEVAYEWLLRHGYINFGCVETPDISDERPRKQKRRSSPKTVLVIGAGMAGLGCARQLEGMFNHYKHKWASAGENIPRVIVLEGRARIGGRIYSHPLRNQNATGIPSNSRCVAEMGAHIITGFDHGNPLKMIIRGQLALPYYSLKDNSSLYDVDGRVVDPEQDKKVENLFNDILDRASAYRHGIPAPILVEGDRAMIEAGKDPTGEATDILSLTPARSSIKGPSTDDAGLDSRIVLGTDQLTGKSHIGTHSRMTSSPARSAEAMGWRLTSNLFGNSNLDMNRVLQAQHPTLGAAMDEGVRQYQPLLDLTPRDLRLLNWHFANLEYANAANVSKLSLGGWDQDIGNEFEGEHAQVIGGFQQVPRGIWEYPSKLDVRTRKVVKHITFDADDSHHGTTHVICEDGETFAADHVILTAPLGVLKSDTMTFHPQLPEWKRHAIQRLGFGTLNKVILVYEEPFWDVDQDMIGLLRDSRISNSLNQADYSQNRGRYYLFWNCIKTSGRPVLIALMAGDAAHQAEEASDEQIVTEVTAQLAQMFKQHPIPRPAESIVTRWGCDRFARGTYSYVASTAHSDDYDSMARRVGNLHFAGEATCGTHPATVHGAYISGLRAASEVMESFLGPIEIPEPLVPPHVKAENIATKPNLEVAALPSPMIESIAAKKARLESYEVEIMAFIFAKLGHRPEKPERFGANPFLLYSKDKWAECKVACDEARRHTAPDVPDARASRNEVRALLGQRWRSASDDVRQPFLQRTASNRLENAASAAAFAGQVATWDTEARALRKAYVMAHPGVLSAEEEANMWRALAVYGRERRTKMSVAEEDTKEEEAEEGTETEVD